MSGNDRDRHTLNDEQLDAKLNAAEREKDRLKQLRMDREKLMKMPEFRRVMADIFARGALFSTVMTGSSMTYYKSGKQDFAREIFSTLVAVNRNEALNLLKIQEEESDG